MKTYEGAISGRFPSRDPNPSKKPSANLFEGFGWRWHAEGSRTRRVWRTDWPGDTFEIVSHGMFLAIKTVCEKFSIPLTDMNEED